jgi:hypothetical protein
MIASLQTGYLGWVASELHAELATSVAFAIATAGRCWHWFHCWMTEWIKLNNRGTSIVVRTVALIMMGHCVEDGRLRFERLWEPSGQLESNGSQ